MWLVNGMEKCGEWRQCRSTSRPVRVNRMEFATKPDCLSSRGFAVGRFILKETSVSHGARDNEPRPWRVLLGVSPAGFPESRRWASTTALTASAGIFRGDEVVVTESLARLRGCRRVALQKDAEAGIAEELLWSWFLLPGLLRFAGLPLVRLHEANPGLSFNQPGTYRASSDLSRSS
jgi:hypothetical protein